MISGTRYRLTLEINRQLRLARDIERGMTEISTGKRIQAPSDDPVGAARVSDIARAQANMATWERNLNSASALSARADDVLGTAEAIVIRAKELMVAAASGTLSNENRATIALELRSIAEEIATIADTRDGRGELLFPTSQALEFPVGDGIRITAVGTRAAIFTAATASGPKDLADIVSDAADAIVDPDPTARAAATAASLDELDAAVTHVASERSEQGLRGSRIDTLLERLAQSSLLVEEERSSIESADVTEVIARLQARQLTLQAAQAAFARINATTLFDILR